LKEEVALNQKKIVAIESNPDLRDSSNSTKSERSKEDAVALMGVGTTNTPLRVLAAFGKIQAAPSEFKPCESVASAGILMALPALLSCGLLRHCSRYFTLPAGYYDLIHIFLMLAYMTLCRVKSIENLSSSPPGEWGKLLGLDRCPAVKTMRNKLNLLTKGKVSEWSAKLSEEWMEEDPGNVGVLYIDGHTRVYHGAQTKLPKHYVARQRLCSRATCDYWVNGFNGLPFFRVNCAVDPGMIHVLENEIIPELERTIPNQPTENELRENPHLSRFRLVFDREGYSPRFFKQLRTKHIACQTYHKYPGEDWAEEEFTLHQVKGITGENIEMQLAERGTLLGSTPAEQIWVKEIRRMTKSGRQISIVSTEWLATPGEIASPQFGRWYQENFFKYMMQHFNLDRLIDYNLEEIDDTTRVVNPAWRKLDSQTRSQIGKAVRKKAKLHDLTIAEGLNPAQIEAYMEKAIELQEEIEKERHEILELKAQRKNLRKHIEIKDLPEEHRFKQLATRSKQFIDTIKIISYRAETAMANSVRPHLGDHHGDESRVYIRKLYDSEANLIPDEKNKTLTVEIHSLATPKENEILKALCEDLNETATNYPNTKMRLIYKLVS